MSHSSSGSHRVNVVAVQVDIVLALHTTLLFRQLPIANGDGPSTSTCNTRGTPKRDIDNGI
jgi:hypothetical protein